MKTLTKCFSALGVFACLAAPLYAPQVTATSINITFATTSDDKDYDTQVRDRIVSNGANMATLFCCSADRKSDHWNNGSTNTRPMNVLQTITKGSLPGMSFVLGEIPNGNDTWVFIPTLTVKYSDNSQDQWTFPEQVLVGRGSQYVEQVLTIPPAP